MPEKLANCRIMVTGANGFIGRNLIVRLNELENIRVLSFVRGDDPAELRGMVSEVDAIIHLAGENRPEDESAYEEVNVGLTSLLCGTIADEYEKTKRHIPIVLASSAQAENETPYGKSKLAAENLVKALSEKTGNPGVIFRLPGVFGKWCKPNYNSVVATFCHNITRGLPIQIHDPTASLSLVYVDDVVASLVKALEGTSSGLVRAQVTPEYAVTLVDLESHIRRFDECRSSLIVERVGNGFLRALYSTYLTYLPSSEFSYELVQHSDERGAFVEMLKTQDSGQFSYFTAHPGITRGGHYHHTKTEKFLVVKGVALFRFRHLLSDELVEFKVDGEKPQVVDTIPGWSHDVTNIGSEELVVMLWANENFDRENPDTFASEL